MIKDRIRHHARRVLHRRTESRVVQSEMRHGFARGELEFAELVIALDGGGKIGGGERSSEHQE
jgi:hypothetical protein